VLLYSIFRFFTT